MTEELKYDRKKLIILRAVLIAVGAGLGGLALWQYFVYFPDVVRREYSIVITVVSALFTALMFGLSAKAIYRLGATIAGYAVSANERLGARGIVATVCGLAAAGCVVVLFDVAIRTVWNIWAVRLLVDVLVYMVCAAFGCYGFIKWANAPKDDENVVVASPKLSGYLIGWECFGDDRVFTAADTLIGAKVCDGAYKALGMWSDDKTAIRRLDELVMSGKVGVLRCNKTFADKAEYTELEKTLAASKRLKFVCGGETEGGVNIAMFVSPDAHNN